ncbi:MAG: acyl-CoA dehydrogenase family protein [Dehalococcoidia bacterium]
MQLTDTQEEAAFRTSVREFMAGNLPPELRAEHYVESEFDAALDRTDPYIARWREALAQKNWVAPHWPAEYGGGGLSVGEQFILNEELATARTPDVGMSGVNLIGPILILHGTPEQKAAHLPRITSGEVVWAQGYSEPGAGSDLASLTTRAVRDGDEWVVSGQKIWTGGAHACQWMFMLTRTDPGAPKHKGISMFLVDLKTPGISVRPIIDIAGRHYLNEVFLEDVRVPAGNIVGEVNQGWYVGAALLDFERSDIRRTVTLEHLLNGYLAAAKESPSARERLPQMKRELADRYIETTVTRLFAHRILSMQKRRLVPNYEASVAKMFRTETHQRIAHTGLRLLGTRGALYRDDAFTNDGGAGFHYLSTLSLTISAGSNEIQRNIVATRGLGLPRD